MGIEEVLDLLEIDTPDEFEYFEHLAELIECTEEISYEAIYALLKDMDASTIGELLNDYFEEVLRGIPDDATDLYLLMTSIQTLLIGLSSEDSPIEERNNFADEFYRFRCWYSLESVVHCKNRSDNLVSDYTLAEALALFRLEKLGGDSFEYDFTEVVEYPIQEYTVTLPYRFAEEPEVAEMDEPEGEGEYADAFIDSEHPVIDGEYEDEDDEDPLI